MSGGEVGRETRRSGSPGDQVAVDLPSRRFKFEAMTGPGGRTTILGAVGHDLKGPSRKSCPGETHSATSASIDSRCEVHCATLAVCASAWRLLMHTQCSTVQCPTTHVANALSTAGWWGRPRTASGGHHSHIVLDISANQSKGHADAPNQGVRHVHRSNHPADRLLWL